MHVSSSPGVVQCRQNVAGSFQNHLHRSDDRYSERVKRKCETVQTILHSNKEREKEVRGGVGVGVWVGWGKGLSDLWAIQATNKEQNKKKRRKTQAY